MQAKVTKYYTSSTIMNDNENNTSVMISASADVSLVENDEPQYEQYHHPQHQQVSGSRTSPSSSLRSSFSSMSSSNTYCHTTEIETVYHDDDGDNDDNDDDNDNTHSHDDVARPQHDQQYQEQKDQDHEEQPTDIGDHDHDVLTSLSQPQQPSPMIQRASKFIVKRHNRFIQSEEYQQLLLTSDCPSSSCSSSSSIPTVTRSQLELGKMLGTGSFSSVYEVAKIVNDDESNAQTSSLSSTSTTTPCVVKCIGPHAINSDEPRVFVSCAIGLAREGAIMMALSQQHHNQQHHPNILRLIATSVNGVEGYATGSSMFLVLERLDMLLIDKIKQWKDGDMIKTNNSTTTLGRRRRRTSRKIPNREGRQMGRFNLHRLIPFHNKNNNNKAITSFIGGGGGGGRHRQLLLLEQMKAATDLANGLSYLHSKRILHRDIKPQNVGFDCHGDLKIFDFDVSRIVPQCPWESLSSSSSSFSDQVFRMTQRVGTRRYMAPEVLLTGLYNLKADVYSFAMVLYQIFSLKTPYKYMSQLEHKERVMVSGERPSIPNKHSCPTVVRSLLKDGWSADMKRRPDMATIQDILKEEMNKMMTMMDSDVTTSSLSSSDQVQKEGWKLKQ